MCIEYNECHYGGMYNINVKRKFFVITEIVHMNADVSSEKEKVKQSQSRSVTPPLDIHFGCRVGGVTHYTCTLYHLVEFSLSIVIIHSSFHIIIDLSLYFFHFESLIPYYMLLITVSMLRASYNHFNHFLFYHILCLMSCLHIPRSG